jgi:hypothetical protein
MCSGRRCVQSIRVRHAYGSHTHTHTARDGGTAVDNKFKEYVHNSSTFGLYWEDETDSQKFALNDV